MLCAVHQLAGATSICHVRIQPPGTSSLPAAGATVKPDEMLLLLPQTAQEGKAVDRYSMYMGPPEGKAVCTTHWAMTCARVTARTISQNEDQWPGLCHALSADLESLVCRALLGPERQHLRGVAGFLSHSQVYVVPCRCKDE